MYRTIKSVLVVAAMAVVMTSCKVDEYSWSESNYEASLLAYFEFFSYNLPANLLNVVESGKMEDREELNVTLDRYCAVDSDTKFIRLGEDHWKAEFSGGMLLDYRDYFPTDFTMDFYRIPADSEGGRDSWQFELNLSREEDKGFSLKYNSGPVMTWWEPLQGSSSESVKYQQYFKGLFTIEFFRDGKLIDTATYDSAGQPYRGKMSGTKM